MTKRAGKPRIQRLTAVKETSFRTRSLRLLDSKQHVWKAHQRRNVVWQSIRGLRQPLQLVTWKSSSQILNSAVAEFE